MKKAESAAVAAAGFGNSGNSAIAGSAPVQRGFHSSFVPTAASSASVLPYWRFQGCASSLSLIHI